MAISEYIYEGFFFLHRNLTQRLMRRAEPKPRKEEVSSSARLFSCCQTGLQALLSGFMEKVSANGSLTPRRGHLGLKYGGIDKYGNHNKAEVCQSNTALLLLLLSRFSSCQCCSIFKSFRKSKWVILKQTI